MTSFEAARVKPAELFGKPAVAPAIDFDAVSVESQELSNGDRHRRTPEIDGTTRRESPMGDVPSGQFRYKLSVAVVENSVMPQPDRSPRRNKLQSGSKSSAWPSTCSVSSKIASTSASFPDLTDQDLEKLGVSLGDRAKCWARSAISAALQLPLRHRRCPWRASLARQCRAPPAHEHVLRPGWLDGAVTCGA
jgi:hypothetical protein